MKVPSMCLTLLVSICGYKFQRSKQSLTFIGVRAATLFPGSKANCVNWKDSETYDEIPDHAIKAGFYRNERLYVCRGIYMDELYPGKEKLRDVD